MNESAVASTAELTFLALAGAEYEIGIAAERVREIVAAAHWDGEPALDISALIPALAGGDGAARVLSIVVAGGGLLALYTTSAIAVRTVDVGALVRVPRVVTRDARWVSGVVFGDKTLPLVVVDPDAIANRVTDAAAATPHLSLEELW